MAEVAGVERATRVGHRVRHAISNCATKPARSTTDEFYDIFCSETKTRARHAGAAAGRQPDLHAQHVDLPGRGRADGRRLSAGHSFEHLPRPLVVLLRRPVLAAQEGLRGVCPELRAGGLQTVAQDLSGAAKLAGCQPEEIFFVDDVPGHVEGARAAGYDAVLYTTTRNSRPTCIGAACSSTTKAGFTPSGTA